MVPFLRFLAAAGFALAAYKASAATEAPDPAIQITTNGSEITLQVAGVTRRDALEKLLGEATTIEWLDEDSADEAVNGNYHGTMNRIIAELLGRSNFIVTYENDGEQLRVSRLLVVGSVVPSVLPDQPNMPEHVNKEHTTTADQRRTHRITQKMRATEEARQKRLQRRHTGNEDRNTNGEGPSPVPGQAQSQE
jgi:hypothetical protein